MSKQKIFAISLDASRYETIRFWFVSIHRAKDAAEADTVGHKVKHYHGQITPSSRERIRRAQEALINHE